MSYDIIRRIELDKKENKVYITSASNNVVPRSYSRWECHPLSEVYKKEGKQAVEIEILKIYESGCFQGGSNKYTIALDVLHHVLINEYKCFSWKHNVHKYNSPEYEEHHKLRKSKEFDLLLLKALNVPKPRNNYIITKNHNGTKVYAKVCKTCVKWGYYPSFATKFKFKEVADANIFKKYKDYWQVEEVV